MESKQSCDYLYAIFFLGTSTSTRWRSGAVGKVFGLAINWSRVQILLEATLRNNILRPEKIKVNLRLEMPSVLLSYRSAMEVLHLKASGHIVKGQNPNLCLKMRSAKYSG